MLPSVRIPTVDGTSGDEPTRGLKDGARLPSAKRRKKPVAAAEPPPYNAADAARVRALVARLGLTQREVASACGVTTSD